MRRESDNFEIMVSRIHDLLEGEGAKVTWNEKIPDPDNIKQARQIDVLVEKEKFKTLIECRLHKAKQDVKWIEELIGRRISLEADSIIAVASNGFTEGAIRKANRYGIILRDIVRLSDGEIVSWARSISMSLLFFRYEGLKLSFFFNESDLKKLYLDLMQRELQEYVGFRSLFTPQLELIHEKNILLSDNRDNAVNFRVNFKHECFYLCGCEVLEIQSEGKAYLEELKLNVPEILSYGEPSSYTEDRNVFIQNYNMGQSRVIHKNGRISMTLDLSKMDVPPYWQFHYLDTKSEFENSFEYFEILDPEKIIMKIDKIDLSIIGVTYNN